MTETESLSVAAMRAAIRNILDERAIAAQRSEYDRSVCVRAVGAAREVIDAVDAVDDGAAYGEAVVAALAPVYENYNDPDGQFTSGKSSIGDVYHDIVNLLQDRTQGGLPEGAHE